MGLSLLSPLLDPMKAVNDLRRENEQIRRDLEEMQEELRQERRKNGTVERGVAELRSVLAPLYQGLQHIFGEIDAMGVGEASSVQSSASSVSMDPRVTAVWESWKQKLGEGPAKIIEALLVHREMNTQQLAIATRYHRTTIPKLIYQLNKAGLLNKNGGRFSLKEL